MAVLLQASHVTMQFGGLKAVNDVDMEIKKGEVHALIGPIWEMGSFPFRMSSRAF